MFGTERHLGRETIPRQEGAKPMTGFSLTPQETRGAERSGPRNQPSVPGLQQGAENRLPEDRRLSGADPHTAQVSTLYLIFFSLPSGFRSLSKGLRFHLPPSPCRFGGGCLVRKKALCTCTKAPFFLMLKARLRGQRLAPN